MNRILTFLGICLLVSISLISSAQDIPLCNQHILQQEYLEEHPEYREIFEQARAQLEAETAARAGGGDDELFIIPVVFHVIHDNGPENISDEQIYNAIEILNRDFRKLNADTAQIHPEFAALSADINIEFRLAQLDPNGECTKGITRTVSDLTYDGGGAMRNLIQWPRDMYMNVWVCNYANGAAGYTFLPSSVDGFFSQGDDGIVLRYDYTGGIGESNVNRSRTLTHEVGHWLNLSHTWGPTNSPGEQENCGSDDGVSDTPETIGWTSCTTNGESCGSLDNVENYMEYSYCSKMFTQGQRNRMRTAAQSSIADRNQLSTEQNLINTGVINDQQLLCAADFSTEDRVICEGQAVNFSDQSYNAVDYWTWDFGDGTVIQGDNPEEFENPTHVYASSGNYTVTLTVENEGESVSQTKNEFVSVLPAGGNQIPFVEGFEQEFPGNDWFVIDDEDEDVVWQTTEEASFSGQTSMFLENRLSDGGLVNDLISSSIDASDTNGIEISFKYAHANKSSEGSSDQFRLQVSGDCGETWSTEIIYFGNTVLPTVDPTFFGFVPQSEDDWREVNVQINDSTLLTENLMMRFRFVGGGGNNFYLDDINIGSQFVSVEELRSASFNWNIYPNPADESAKAHLNVKDQDNFRIYITDLAGRKVKSLVDKGLSRGEHMVDLPVAELRSGMYLIVIETDTYRDTKRISVRH